MIITDFEDLIAERMGAEHRLLAGRWFERLRDLLPVEAEDIFPTESLLDHIPALILEISGYLRHPEEGAIAANTAVLEKARELGALRHGQKASLHQLLREYQVLSGVLVTFVLEEMERLQLVPPASESVRLVSRLHQAVDVLSQATVEAFVMLYTRTIADQSERLEQFTRMAAHEWRQPLGALQFGVALLSQANLDQPRQRRTLEAVERNVKHLVDLTHTLEAVARMHHAGDNPVVQEVSLTTIAAEAARQLREMADARGVEIRIADTLPTLTIDVGRLELAFVNLLSNAIKYSDPAKSTRYVEVTGAGDSETRCRIAVRDNGIGIPQEALDTIFQRFTRAHAQHEEVSHVGGLGLGLSIVADCARAMGGQIEVESSEHVGTTFVVNLPRSPSDRVSPALPVAL
ncbi:MAG: HAMP domain-containing sensor histidine kinase [Vicinamibacterales bacterium]